MRREERRGERSDRRRPAILSGSEVRRGTALNRVRRPAVALFLGLVAFAPVLRAQNSLFYLEAQAVGAYSFGEKAFQLFSLSADEPMQKESLGFDFLTRFRGSGGDIGYFSLQARLGYDGTGDHPFEVQVYNAFFRFKLGFADLWAGHARPALGLSYVLDNHALLLPDPAMLGFGLDRDWGFGLHRDLERGDLAVSLTAGTGMDLKFDGSFLASGRVSMGVAARDNYNIGLSFAAGRMKGAMDMSGMEEMEAADPAPWTQGSLDGTFLYGSFETRGEVSVVKAWNGTRALFMARQGLNLLEENRLKLELQPAVRRMAGAWRFLPGAGVTYIVTPDLTARAMVYRDRDFGGTRLVFQLYYYQAL